MHRVSYTLICVAALLASLGTTGVRAVAKNWSAGDGDWNVAGNWSPATLPTLSEAVNIAFTDGSPRTVNYNVSAPSLGLLTIDLTGAGASASTLSIPGNNSLAANGIYVGGYSGITGLPTAGRGALEQSAETVTTNSGWDLVVGHGVGSMGTYTLSGGALVANQSEFIGFSGTGTFNHSAGTNTINASGVGSLDLGGFSGATGTYNLSGTAALSVNAHEYVGDGGIGFFNHTGGTNTIVGAGHNLYLGFGASGIGEYVISGTAALSAGGNVIVGNNGTGALVIQDQASVFITNSLTINSSINNLSTVNLNGGTLRFNTLSGITRVNYTAGTIQLAGNRDIIFDAGLFDFYGASRVIPAGKGLKVEGTTTIRQDKTLTVSGGTFTSQGLLTLGAPGFSSGDLIINNGGTVVAGADVKLDTFGIANVSGAGSSWTVAGNFQVSPTGGRGDLSISNQASLYIGNTLSIGSSGFLILNGGTIRFNGYSRDVVGAFTFTAGTVQLAGNRTLGSDAATLDLFGAAPTIPTGKALVVEGTATIAASAVATLSGGTLSAQTVLMSPGSRLVNTQVAQVSGVMLALAGSTIDATGADLTVGDATKVNGFYGAGTLQIGPSTVTLADANDAVLDSAALLTLGAGGNPGTLVAANGLTLDFGGNVTGFGTVETPNSAATPLINNGHISGDTPAEPITLAGYVKGVGTLDNVVITGTDAPGFSPATVVRGSVVYDGALEIEIGGTAAGSFDRINHVLGAATADLGGALDVTLISGFSPILGDSIEIITALGGVSGAFDTPAESLPGLSPGLKWAIHYGANNVVLQIVAAGLAGDYNQNGIVDAADYTVWRNNLGGTTSLPNDDTPGVGPDDYIRWKINFGQTAGSGSGAIANAAVPEPATAAMLFLAMLAMCTHRRAVVS